MDHISIVVSIKNGGIECNCFLINNIFRYLNFC